MMNCRKATQLISEAQERKLSLRETVVLRLHTLMCSGCCNFETQVAALRKLSRHYARGGKPEGDDGTPP